MSLDEKFIGGGEEPTCEGCGRSFEGYKSLVESVTGSTADPVVQDLHRTRQEARCTSPGSDHKGTRAESDLRAGFWLQKVRRDSSNCWKRAHLSGPGTSNTTKIPREDPQRGKKRTRNFGPPTLSGPRSSRLGPSWSL